MDPTSGYAFTGPSHIHSDIYPSINPLASPSLQQTGKSILITGAGRGIGRAIALQYAHASVSTLILCARTASELSSVASSIRAMSANITVLTHTVDVTSASCVAQLAESVQRDVGRLDVLVNNAGASEPWVPVAQSQPADWWNTFQVNLKGPYLFTQAFLPLLVATAETHETNVHIVSLSSIGANFMVPGASAYQTSKHALGRFMEFVNLEYGDKGVVAVSVNPGGVPTKLAKGVKVIDDYLIDTPELCGGTVVWLTAEPRTWLAGRYVSSTWDVDVLEGMKEEIVAGDKLKAKLVV